MLVTVTSKLASRSAVDKKHVKLPTNEVFDESILSTFPTICTQRLLTFGLAIIRTGACQGDG